MAASANPSGGHNNGTNNNNGNNNNNNRQNQANDAAASNGLAASDNSGPAKSSLRHNPGISSEWTNEEQSTLEDLLTKYAAETTNVVKYAKIAQALKDKTVRDVALRCRWMNKKENGKRRKDDSRKRDKKEKVSDSVPKSSQVANRSNGPPYVQNMVPVDNSTDDGISFQSIGGTAGHLLEQSALALDQISANFSAFKVHENVNLFCQARNNILQILNDFADTPEIMKAMPPLPVKLNEDLARSILPQTSLNNS